MPPLLMPLPSLRMLPLAHRLATLPAADLAALELPQSCYNIGWSRGREKLDGRPDMDKASDVSLEVVIHLLYPVLRRSLNSLSPLSCPGLFLCSMYAPLGNLLLSPAL